MEAGAGKSGKAKREAGVEKSGEAKREAGAGKSGEAKREAGVGKAVSQSVRQGQDERRAERGTWPGKSGEANRVGGAEEGNASAKRFRCASFTLLLPLPLPLPAVQVKCKFENRPFKRTGWGTNYRTGGGRTPPYHEFEANPIWLLNQTKKSVMGQKKQLFSHPFTSIQEHYRSTTRLGENWSRRDSKVIKNLLRPVSVYFLKKAGGENRLG